MNKMILATVAAMAIFTFSGVAQADGKHDRRKGYQQYHSSPRSYHRHDRPTYRRGYRAPAYRYDPYGRRHYNQRTIYFNFFGLPIVTY